MTQTTATKATSTVPTDKTNKNLIEMITLDQLANEMNLPARDARMLLRLAAKQAKQYPNLGKEHEPRQPWQWAPGSKALDEARRALSNPVET